MNSMLKNSLVLGAFIAAVFTINSASAGPSAPSKAPADAGPDVAKMWAQNCTRCHNMRPAKGFSDAQWDVLVHHMRVRGNITGSDARAIAEFLKGAN